MSLSANATPSIIFRFTLVVTVGFVVLAWTNMSYDRTYIDQVWSHFINEGVAIAIRNESGRHSFSDTRSLLSRNASALASTDNHERNGEASSVTANVRYIVKPTPPRSPNTNTTKAWHGTALYVGYFEGARRSWTYPNLFRPPESPRTCGCLDWKGVSRQVVVTSEKRAEETGKFDILFIPRDVGAFNDKNEVWETILSVAPPNQRRVYATFEGAYKLRQQTPMASPFRNKFFHWSWTHHSNSDFPMPYGFYKYNHSKLGNVVYKNWAESKTGLVAWMSTWTTVSWRRSDFVELLQQYLNIALFGKSHKKCPRNSNECEQKMRSYKFYLALENSCCGEYITEKFWRTLSWDVVPIVVGANRSDYERLAPPNSFIYADDFNSVKELVDYVIYLNNTDDEYNKYFSWKSQGDVHINYPSIQEQPVKSTVPPENFFYSCQAVCRVAERYNKERYENGGNPKNISRYFDPNNDWWSRSCTTCGQHKWIQEGTRRSKGRI